MAAVRCDGCGAPFDEGDEPVTTATGRELCGECHDRLLGAAAGSIASDGDAATTIATAGWFARLRRPTREAQQRDDRSGRAAGRAAGRRAGRPPGEPKG